MPPDMTPPPEGPELRDDSSDAYDYELPPELVAQAPPEARDGSRLLVLDRAGSQISARRFLDLPDLLREDDILVVNDTRVVPARIHGARDATGGRAEALILETLSDGLLRVLLRTRGSPRAGESFAFAAGRLRLEFRERCGDGTAILRSDLCEADLRTLLDAHGRAPLPPYVRRREDDPRDSEDRIRYQTVFARNPGAVAAPTAGLHFTEDLLSRLRSRGIRHATVTLHVGLGTWKPLAEGSLDRHVMHAEAFRVPPETADLVNAARRRGGRVVAVGTTSVRALESATSDAGVEARSGETRIFIRPPWRFRAVDALVTNFHMPRTSLLVLVAAFAGRDLVLRAYRHAIAERFRLLSWGDAMLIL